MQRYLSRPKFYSSCEGELLLSSHSCYFLEASTKATTLSWTSRDLQLTISADQNRPQQNLQTALLFLLSTDLSCQNAITTPILHLICVVTMPLQLFIEVATIFTEEDASDRSCLSSDLHPDFNASPSIRRWVTTRIHSANNMGDW